MSMLQRTLRDLPHTYRSACRRAAALAPHRSPTNAPRRYSRRPPVVTPTPGAAAAGNVQRRAEKCVDSRRAAGTPRRQQGGSGQARLGEPVFGAGGSLRMARTVILGGARTPFGVLGGKLKDIPATTLGGIAIRAALERSGVAPHEVDNVLMGMVVQAGAGQIPSRQASMAAGLPETVTSETINKVCASGMRAVNLGDALIRSGEADVVVAGGMES